MNVVIVILLLSVRLGQEIPASLTPPTNALVFHATRKLSIKVGNTNDYQPHITHVTIRWDPSRSPGIVTQQLWATLVIPPRWFFDEGISNGLTNVVVSITNYMEEFFTVRCGNTSCWSQLP